MKSQSQLLSSTAPRREVHEEQPAEAEAEVPAFRAEKWTSASDRLPTTPTQAAHRARGPPAVEDARLGARATFERYGISDRTLDRWIGNPNLNFPAPCAIITGRRYWRLGDLLDWEHAQAIAAASRVARDKAAIRDG